MRRIARVLPLLAALATAAPALAQDPFPGLDDPPASRGFGIGNDYLRLSGRMQNLFLWRNDRDFDRTPPYYDAQGQEVGVLGTFLAPMLEITPVAPLRMVMELEIGLDIWSLQDPDVYATGEQGSFRLAIRQLYSEGRFFDGALGFRVGYEQLFDLSGLFLGHWLGAASLSTAHEWGRLTLTAAQMPDQTYEGVAFDDNNFRSDTFVYGLRGDFPLPGTPLELSVSLWGLHDTQVVDQPLDLMTATARLTGEWDTMRFAFDAGWQYGVTKRRAAGGDETTLAWSLQGSFDLVQPLGAGPADLSLLLHLNVMALSGDDRHDGNDRNGAWFYSGKSRSRTLLLSEDDLRDRGGNIDELLAERRHGDSGKFFLVRPGLLLADVSLGLDAFGFFRPLLTLGAAITLNPDNALGGRFVGFETDLHLELYYERYLSFDLVGSLLLPGKAAAAFANRTGDRGSTDTVFQVEAVMTLYF